jgi:20S proteasome alpha/beta subunit
MSIIIAFKLNTKEVVFAADRRGTFGDPRQLVCIGDNHKKWFRYGQSIIGIVDSIGHVLPSVNYARETLNNTMNGQDRNMASSPLDTLYNGLKHKYITIFGNRSLVSATPQIDDRPTADILYIDEKSTEDSGLYVLPSQQNFGPVLISEPFCVIGSQFYAKYLYQRLWKADYTVNDAVRLAVFMVSETSKVDPKVGGGVDVVVLSNARVQEIPQTEIEEIERINELHFKTFADSFQDKRK